MSRNGFWLLGLIAILVIAAGMANAQDSQNITCINRFYHNWGSGVRDVAVGNGYAYLACDNGGLYVVDISNPDAMREVSHPISASAYSLVYSGNYIYMESYSSGIRVINVADPVAPYEASTIQTSALVQTMVVDGSYLFAGSQDEGLIIVDIHQPGSGQIVGRSQESYDISGLAVRGSTLYAACNINGLVVYDISDIDSPVITDTYVLGGYEYVTGVDVAGDYAYLSCGFLGFQVVDLNTMTAVADINSLTFAYEIQVDGDYAYMTYGDPECPLAAIDISNPLEPQIADIYFPPEDILNFVMDGNTIYVADNNHGLRLVDRSNPSALVERASYNRCGGDYDVYVSGNYAYVRESNKLKVIDISDMLNPAEIGYYENRAGVKSMKVIGNIAYLMEQTDQCLRTIDISDPCAPTLIGTYEGQVPAPFDMDVYGNYAYITQNNGVLILDVSDPANITYAGSYDEHMYNGNVLITDHYAFVVTNMGGVRVLDISSDPASPDLIATYDLGEWSAELRAVDDYLYILSSQKLWVFEIGDFQNWSPICEQIVYEYPGGTTGMAIDNGYAFLTNERRGLQVYDMRSLASPQMVGFYDTPGFAFGVFARDDLAIVADGSNLGFYDCSDALTGIGGNTDILPGQFALLSNYPNPFNSSTNVQFELVAGGDIQLTIFDALGRQVKTLTDYQAAPGRYSLNWDGTDMNGLGVASGRYYIRATADGQVRTLPVTLLK